MNCNNIKIFLFWSNKCCLALTVYNFYKLNYSWYIYIRKNLVYKNWLFLINCTIFLMKSQINNMPFSKRKSDIFSFFGFHVVCGVSDKWIQLVKHIKVLYTFMTLYLDKHTCINAWFWTLTHWHPVHAHSGGAVGMLTGMNPLPVKLVIHSVCDSHVTPMDKP